MLRIDVQVVAGDALIDDQDDVMADFPAIARQAHRLPGPDLVGRRLVGEEVEIGQWCVHLRQPAGTFATAQEKDGRQQHYADHWRGDHGPGRQPRGPARRQGDAQQQRQADHHAPDDRRAILRQRFVDKTAGVDQGDEGAVGQVIGHDPPVHVEEHRAGEKCHADQNAHRPRADLRGQQQHAEQHREQPCVKQQWESQPQFDDALPVIREAAQQIQRQEEFFQVTPHSPPPEPFTTVTTGLPFACHTSSGQFQRQAHRACADEGLQTPAGRNVGAPVKSMARTRQARAQALSSTPGHRSGRRRSDGSGRLRIRGKHG
ncbi:hypothetical protein D3C72_1431050 [compost metagenome]